jgi:anaerobic magnesium-protoporphyrin IX monomethyl ester cyclase
VVGEGELAFKQIIDAYRAEGLHAHGSPMIINGMMPKLSDIPLPARHLVEHDKYCYMDPHGDALNSMMTSRGCPSRCTFCCLRMFGPTTRYFPVSHTLEEIEYLIREWNAKSMHFQDDCFTTNVSHVKELCTAISERKYGIKYRCRARVVDLARKTALPMLHQMRESGCDTIVFGIESGNQSILDRINKCVTLDRIRIAVDNVKNSGMRVKGSFILGLPGDNSTTLSATIDFAVNLNLDELRFTLATPLPGTELWDLARMDQRIANDPSLYDDAFMFRDDLQEHSRLFVNLSEVPDDELLAFATKARDLEVKTWTASATSSTAELPS